MIVELTQQPKVYLTDLFLRLTSMKEQWRSLYKAYIKRQQTQKEALKCRSICSLFLSLHYRITALIYTALKRSVTQTVPFTTKEYSHTSELLNERSNTRLKYE